MKRLFLPVLLPFIQCMCFAQPVITSFTPQAALPLTQVAISGSGFSVINDSNTVYFGAVKAVVNTAAVNQLTVTVPAGTSYRCHQLNLGKRRQLEL